jgi:putative ABC transport system ATP-binding protein
MDTTNSEKAPMIRLQNIKKVYRTDTVETLAINDISLTINRGEFLSVMGPSGCGKSTLLNIIGLLDKPTNGAIQIDGQGTEKLSDKQLAQFRNKKLGFIFQSYHLINDLKVAGQR